MTRVLLSLLLVAVVLHVSTATYHNNNNKKGYDYKGTYKGVYKPYNNGKYYGTYNRRNYYCSRPSTIHYGGFYESAKKSWPVGSYVNYYCSPGYKLVGYSKAECKYNYKTYKGYWTYAAPKCVRIRPNCGKPKELTYGSVKYTSTYYGARAYYYCNTGYYLSGPSVRYCNWNGKWNSYAPTCNKRSYGYGHDNSKDDSRSYSDSSDDTTGYSEGSKSETSYSEDSHSDETGYSEDSHSDETGYSEDSKSETSYSEDSETGYSEDSNSETSYSKDSHSDETGYSEDSHSDETGYSEDSHSDETGYSEDSHSDDKTGYTDGTTKGTHGGKKPHGNGYGYGH